MRDRALLVSIVAHGVLAASLLSLFGDDRPAPKPKRMPVDVEVVEPLPPPPPPPQPAPPASAPAAPATASTPVPAPAAPSHARSKANDEDLARALAAIGSEPSTWGDLSSRDLRRNTGRDGFSGGGAGEGGGGRGGTGRGIGFGEGGGIGDSPQLPSVPAAPPPPPVSKARPAKLIYPAREGEAAEGELFIARVTVDTDGYVVGAKLVQGSGDHRDETASQLIWRFRYSPALDDDGRAIRSTLDQSFMVQ